MKKIISICVVVFVVIFVGNQVTAQQTVLPIVDPVVLPIAYPQYYFENDLRLGSSGQSVMYLQDWLIQNGFDIPAISRGTVAKGYFGSQTQGALMAYQRSRGLPSYGFFGPMTRKIINGGYIDKALPLQVTSPNGGEVWQKGTIHNITWTGASGLMNQRGNVYLQYPLPACAEPTYSGVVCMIAVPAPELILQDIDLSTGSYSWKVGDHNYATCQAIGCPVQRDITEGKYKIQICANNANSNSNACDVSNDYFTISNSSNQAGPLAITNPTSGTVWQKDKNYTITWTSPYYIRATYADILLYPVPTPDPVCNSNVPNVGACQVVTGFPAPIYIAQNININQNYYSWTVNAPIGKYRVTLCEHNTSNCALSVNITVTSNDSSKAPIINGIDSPTTLNVNQTGTWTIRATDPNNGTLSYSVDWGDTAYIASPNASVSSSAYYQTTTFTHSYSSPGTYTVTFTVTNSAGMSTKTTSTVRVLEIWQM